MPRRESANSLNWYYLTISNFGRGEREVRCIVNGIKKLMDFFPNLGESPGAII